MEYDLEFFLALVSGLEAGERQETLRLIAENNARELTRLRAVRVPAALPPTTTGGV